MFNKKIQKFFKLYAEAQSSRAVRYVNVCWVCWSQRCHMLSLWTTPGCHTNRSFGILHGLTFPRLCWHPLHLKRRWVPSAYPIIYIDVYTIIYVVLWCMMLLCTNLLLLQEPHPVAFGCEASWYSCIPSASWQLTCRKVCCSSGSTRIHWEALWNGYSMTQCSIWVKLWIQKNIYSEMESINQEFPSLIAYICLHVPPDSETNSCVVPYPCAPKRQLSTMALAPSTSSRQLVAVAQCTAVHELTESSLAFWSQGDIN